MAPSTRIVNEYGPTETVVGCCVHVFAGEDIQDPVPIGLPIANMSLHLLNSAGEPVPVGVVGDIFIGGTGLGVGYVGRPDLTAERFVTDPRQPDRRLYRTGDLGRRRPDGAIEYLGRIDDQLKIRGMRVEPGEIEATLCRHPDITAAAVIAVGDPANPRLRAFVTSPCVIDCTTLRGFLGESLPSYMIPDDFTPLDHLPVTSNGKLDRKTLAKLRTPAAAAAPTDLAGWSESESRVAAAWSAVLNKPATDLDADFFQSGGDSLAAVRVHNQLVTGALRPLSITDIFRLPTIRLLAAYLDGRDERSGEEFL